MLTSIEHTLLLIQRHGGVLRVTLLEGPASLCIQALHTLSESPSILRLSVSIELLWSFLKLKAHTEGLSVTFDLDVDCAMLVDFCHRDRVWVSIDGYQSSQCLQQGTIKSLIVDLMNE